MEKRGKERGGSCPLCYESFDNKGDKVPMVLHCGHSLCLSCSSFLLLSSSSEDNWTVDCPLCLCLSVGLSKNYALLEVIDCFGERERRRGERREGRERGKREEAERKYLEKKREEHMVKMEKERKRRGLKQRRKGTEKLILICELCVKERGTVNCLDCLESCCVQCQGCSSSLHSFSGLSSHRVVSLTGPKDFETKKKKKGVRGGEGEKLEKKNQKKEREKEEKKKKKKKSLLDDTRGYLLFITPHYFVIFSETIIILSRPRKFTPLQIFLRKF